MYVNKSITRAGIQIAVSVSLAFAVPVRYSIEKTSANGVTIGFALPPSSIASSTDRCALFAFSTKPGLSFTATANAMLSGNTIAIPVRPLSTGWMGSSYLQWIEIDLSNALAIPHPSIFGSLQITYGAPLLAGVAASSLSIKNNMLLFPAPSTGLAKKNIAQLPVIPFEKGLKMGILRDGIYQVTYQDLTSAGVPVSSIPASRYRMFVKEREIPLHTTAAPQSVLKSGDAIFFYGEYLRGASAHYTQYSNTNVYWLTWDVLTPGIRMAIVSGELRRDETRYSVDSVELRAKEMYDTIHLEEDNDIRWFGGIDNPGEMIENASPDSAIDNWYWGFIGMDELTSFTILIPSPAKTGKARMRVALMGLTSAESDPYDHQVSVLINNNPAGANNIAVWDGQKPYVFESEFFPANLLTKGKNTVSFIVKRRTVQDRSVLNWIELEYPRSFKAEDDRIVFKSGTNAVGAVTMFELTDFTSSSLDLWDILKYRVFWGFETRRGTGNNRDLFSFLFQDSIPTPTTYFAQSTSQRLTPAWLKLDTIQTGWDTLGQVDYLVIGPSWARSITAPLCDLHTRCGLRTAFIDIAAIYNRFSFGICDPESIRSLLASLYDGSSSRDHAPRFLLLAGDCTHDLDKKNGDRTIVPTHLAYVPGWGAASDDDYFVTVRGDDQFADLCVGRFPAENEQQLAVMVEKTVNYIQSPSRGFWRDNLLLASGYETEFTSFTCDLSDGLVGPRMNILRMDADPQSPFYKDELTASGVMANYINQGVYAINFNGHGGGNIWSDSRFFGYEDLGRLHNGEWGKSGRLPIVFSFTCLTGFFESVFYRSLGEEFVRSNKDGAICFYGASAYTSKKGNMALDRLLLDMALTSGETTVGELIRAGEIAMLVQNGAVNIPLVRQYNLLGDPALPWRLTPDTLRCTLDKNNLSQGDSVSIEGFCSPVRSGSASVTIGAGNTLWSRTLASVKNGSFAQAFSVKEEVKTASGIVRAYAWNDTFEVRGWAQFSKDTIMVRDIRVTPSSFGCGDTVTISCFLAEPSDTVSSTVYCLYAIASPPSTNADFQGIRMQPDSSGRWTTPRRVPITFTEDINRMLLIRFRVQSGELSKESGISAFAIAGRPDLTFTGISIPVTWSDDSLRADFEVLNKGTMRAPRFGVTFFWGEGAGADTIGKVVCSTLLEPGKTWNTSLALPDTQGSLPFIAVINDGPAFEEASFINNQSSGTLRVFSASLRTPSDTLWAGDSAVALVPASSFKKERTLFLFNEPVPEAQPLLTASRWLTLRSGSVMQASVGSRPALEAGDSLRWLFMPESLPSGFTKGITQTASGKIAIMRKDSTVHSWRFTGASRSGNAPSIALTSSANGPYALGFLEDTRPPSIQVLVYGKELRFLDYAAKDQPFNILCADPSGVLPASVAIRLNRKPLNAGQASALPEGGDVRNITVTTYPPKENKIDSLFVMATDLAGNQSELTFAYMAGQDLTINFFSCHPNPFSIRARGVNGPPQKVIFAFELTDLADVTLSIYTVRGKKIRSWKSAMAISGYNEFPPGIDNSWDGRDQDGFRIANGTYYAKLVAKGVKSKKTASKIIRIAKLEGY
jgi:hypothetical protein